MTAAGAEEGGTARGGRRALVLALYAALACAAPAPPPLTGLTADYDAPRPAVTASFIRASAYRAARGDLEGALRAAEQARAAGPESAAAQLREAEARAALAFRDGDAEALAEARSDIDALRTEHPDAAAPRLAALRLALRDGRLEETAADARALSSERPDWAAPRAILSEALRSEDPAAALEEAEQAVRLAPSDPDAIAARARAHSALASDTAAAEDARRALRLRRDADVERLLVHSLLRRGDTKRAIESGEKVLEAERSSGLELLLARAYWATGQRDIARAAAARARTRAAGDPEAEDDAFALATELAIADGRTAEALAELETARAARPEDARLAELAALCQVELGRLPEAEASARRSVELDGTRPSAWETLAGILDAAGRPLAQERARDVFGAGGGGDPRAEALAGLLAERAGDARAAAASYEAALARDPSLVPAQLHLARILAAEGRDAPRAVELAEAARRKAGWSRETAETLARALRASGRAADAAEAYRIAWAQVPPGVPGVEPLVLELAEALEAAGRSEQALALATSLIGRRKPQEDEPPWLAGARELRKQILGARAAQAGAAAAAP